MKIGFGFDAHELAENKVLKLGGVTIEFPKGLRGHSDGDVVLHAISDAVLGSCAAGDIGMFFRDDDTKIQGIDSRKILAFSLEKSTAANLRPRNIDIVIVADQPKLSDKYEILRQSISELCRLDKESVSVKAKTSEGTLVGRDSIACFAVILMEDL